MFKSSERSGKTKLLMPTVGIRTTFQELRSGDFFLDRGQLYLKINLEHSVEIPSGATPLIGTSTFTPSHTVYVVDVEISIK